MHEKLKLIENEILKMADSVKDLIIKSFRITTSKISMDMIDELEKNVNDFENQIENHCIKYMALYQPEAFHLRMVVMILKINNDLERIGDLAFKIAKTLKYLHDNDFEEVNGDIEEMRKIMTRMFEDAIISFKNKDEKLAGELLERDDIVDEMQKQAFKDIKVSLIDDEVSEVFSFNKIRITNAIERIADLVTNIAESVIYIKTGASVKHLAD